MADEGDFVPEAGGSLEKLQEEVFLDDNQIKSGLSNLARSSNGRDYVYVSLDLIGKNLHTLDDIKTYQEIKYVNVKNNQLTSGSPLSDLANLVTANLQYNNITDFADMKSSSLQLLQLDNNKLTAIANSSFPALRALTLSKNIIPNLGDLSSFYPALEVLDLSGNKLTSLAVCV
jgi:Leucine-rich repeat (LRR) protein